MKKPLILTAIAALTIVNSIAATRPAALPAAPAQMPVKEITVFKDGHVFVLHEGAMHTDDSGNVLMDYLPSPVIGTFWPYSSNKNVKLTSVLAGQHRVNVERTALNLRELLEANTGSQAIITEQNGPSYSATILGIPSRVPDESETNGVVGSGLKPSQKGDVILVKTADGTKVVPLGRIQDVTFLSSPNARWTSEEIRNRLMLKLDWGRSNPEKTADIGMVYLQRGVRWIPGYKITIDGSGNAMVKLQATLLNELTDLEDVTANLVIGVPTFAFKETVDPISLQQSVAQLSQHFRQNERTAYAFSNAIMTQTASQVENRAPVERPPTMDLGPDTPESAKSEDLFVFTVRHITLKKGERMVIPIAEYPLKYEDVFTLDLPFAPPVEITRNFDVRQQSELARLFNAPKVIHKIRLTNKSIYPLTTAPALVVRGDRVLAQGLMTYTGVGGSCDLSLTDAVDIQVTKTDTETRRIPNAVRWQNDDYARVELAGTIRLTNRRGEAIRLEITRHVLGNVDAADNDAKMEKANVFEDHRFLPSGDYPVWWYWYNWPYWWRHFNGVGRIRWETRLEDGKSVDLGYTWHYYWR
ncbi:MAG: hypothetical protein L0229_15930 [Blastocatellia bacterium]|nr:hypothetical protein [Blastocatellia bacterium]